MVVLPVEEQLQDPVQPREFGVLWNLDAAPNRWFDIAQADLELENRFRLFHGHCAKCRTCNALSEETSSTSGVAEPPGAPTLSFTWPSSALPSTAGLRPFPAALSQSDRTGNAEACRRQRRTVGRSLQRSSPARYTWP